MITKIKALVLDREFRGRVLRFAIVGGIATAIYLIVSFYLVSRATNIAIAHITAYIVSLLASYVLQKTVTFQVQGKYLRTGTRFLVATILIAGVHFLIVTGLTYLNFNPYFSLVAGAFFYPIASFGLHSIWTFKSD